MLLDPGEILQAAAAHLWLPRPRPLLLYTPQPLLIARELPAPAPSHVPRRPADRRAPPLGHRVRLLPPKLDLEAFQPIALPGASHALASPPRAQPSIARTTLPEALSERELELLRALAQGYSNRELAELLGISAGTVRWHLTNIYGKLGVQRRTQAIARARALRLIEVLPGST